MQEDPKVADGHRRRQRVCVRARGMTRGVEQRGRAIGRRKIIDCTGILGSINGLYSSDISEIDGGNPRQTSGDTG